MKFHRVKLENLNSLYGEQTIDFEEDIRSAPLFLIIGPTGAGKSTILDAICLALFGQTPRLERRTGHSDTDVAHIMSMGTANAMAEVEFSVLESDGSRTRYLAVWSCRRAYDDPEGAVQRPERALYQKFPDGRMKLVVADHREKYYQAHFDRALRGLSVQDFQRSILLAQGEFSAFLHASDSEKASILERLTNTDQYRRIGERAARRRKTVEARHQRLLTRLEEMQVLTVPEEEALASDIEESEKLERKLASEQKAAAKKLEWIQKLEELEAAVETANEALDEAREAQESRKADYQRLERDAELQDVEPAWRALEREQTNLAEIDERLEPLAEKLEKLSEKKTELSEQTEEHAETLAAAEKALRDAEPAIREAHELRTRRESATRELQTAKKTFGERKATAKATGEKTEKLEKERKSTLDTLEDLREQLEEFAGSGALAEGLSSIRTRVETVVVPLRERIAERNAEIEKHRETLAEVQERRTSFDDSLQDGNKERATWQGQVTRARNKLDGLIGKWPSLTRAIGSLSADLESASMRGEALREARYLLGRIEENEEERDEVYARLDQIREEVETLEREEAELKERESTHRALVRQCEESLRQNERLIALSSYRQELDSGDPCPLCGSPIHPYCESEELGEVDREAHADRRRLEAQLEDARDGLRAANEKVQFLASKYVSRRTALRHEESRYIALRTTLESDQAAFARSAENAGYTPLEAFRLKDSAILTADLAEATQVASDRRRQLDAIEQARQQLERAEAQLEQSNEQRAEVEAAVKKLDDDRRQLEDRIVTRERDRKSLDDQLSETVDTLRDELAAMGITRDEEETIEQTLVRASERRERLVDLRERAEKAGTRVDRQAEELERLEEKKTAADRAAAEASEAVDARAEHLSGIEEKIADTLDGADPEEAKKALDAAVEKARKQAENTGKALAAVEQQISAAKTLQTDLQERRQTASTTLEKANARLNDTLERLELERDEVARHLLAPDERKRLQKELRKLDEATVRATTRVQDAEKRVTKHGEHALAAPDESLEEVAEAHEALVRAVNEATLQLGALRERWQKHERTKSRRAEIEDERKEVQHQLDVWTTIYGLIGVGEGERFKLFAQSLNLQGLVDRANHRLEKLHPRYRLSVARGDAGEPTLSFLVEDRYQANVERPLTTLSGGETFLVSLALALGLADFRRIEMPVETLLLDEGFGTLDQDSLHLALTTLHQLHQDGTRQIGIISHVDALKELIDARIVVEPRGHGRSTIRFEFGADESNPLFVVR